MRVHSIAKAVALAATTYVFTPAAVRGQDEEAIKQSIQSFVASWSRHDAKAMSAFFAEDSRIISPTGRIATGGTEVQKLLEEEQRSLGKDSTVTLTSADFRVLTPSTATSDWDVEISGTRGEDPRKQHVAVVHIKRDGQWFAIAGRFYVFGPSRP